MYELRSTIRARSARIKQKNERRAMKCWCMHRWMEARERMKSTHGHALRRNRSSDRSPARLNSLAAPVPHTHFLPCVSPSPGRGEGEGANATAGRARGRGGRRGASLNLTSLLIMAAPKRSMSKPQNSLPVPI
jgi:hypothetical protein